MIKLPKSKKIKGLYIYCNSCKILSADQEKIKLNCKCPDKETSWTYRIRIKISGRRFASKSLSTKDLNKAIEECSQFFKQKDQIVDDRINFVNGKISLAEAMEYYLNYLNNVNIPDYQYKKRSKAHIDEVERYFRYCKTALLLNKVNPKLLRLDSLNKTHVGYCHSFILNEKKFNNRTYNKFIRILRIFMDYSRRNIDNSIINPFTDVVSKTVKNKVEIITKEEFSLLLDALKESNGFKTWNKGIRINLYRPWLRNAFKLGLYSGRRREEIAKLKFSDIILDVNETPLFIKCEHYKVNRIRNITDEDSKDHILIPVTQELFLLLKDLNYEELKNTESYLIAPDDLIERSTVINILSRSFSHFYKLLDTRRNLQFKCLRKTYITQLYMKYGESTKIITHHSDMEVIRNHYLDQKPLLESVRDFKVFD